jgi:hypothetical protein
MQILCLVNHAAFANRKQAKLGCWGFFGTEWVILRSEVSADRHGTFLRELQKVAYPPNMVGYPSGMAGVIRNDLWTRQSCRTRTSRQRSRNGSPTFAERIR